MSPIMQNLAKGLLLGFFIFVYFHFQNIDL